MCAFGFQKVGRGHRYRGLKCLSQTVKYQTIKSLQVLRIGAVWIPFRTVWKYDVKKEALL